MPVKAVEKPVQNVESRPIPDHKIVGEALKTYIIVEQDDKLILIDKHAAHERMIFDRLKAQERELMAQNLLIPVTIRPNGDDMDAITENAALLYELGFEIEPFGERELIVRAVPADMDAGTSPLPSRRYARSCAAANARMRRARATRYCTPSPARPR